MQVYLTGRYFNTSVEVDAKLLRQIWEAPETVGGGAEKFRVNGGGTCWKTAEGWGFVRVGDPSFGKVEFVDPMPGRGSYVSVCPKSFQMPEQQPYPHGVTAFV